MRLLKPKKEDDGQFKACMNCAHYEPAKNDMAVEWSRGCCRHTGLSTCPPMHLCKGWAKRKRND